MVFNGQTFTNSSDFKYPEEGILFIQTNNQYCNGLVNQDL